MVYLRFDVTDNLSPRTRYKVAPRRCRCYFCSSSCCLTCAGIVLPIKTYCSNSLPHWICCFGASCLFHLGGRGQPLPFVRMLTQAKLNKIREKNCHSLWATGLLNLYKQCIPRMSFNRFISSLAMQRNISP